MVRKAEFEKQDFFDATLTLLKLGGLNAVTMKAIAVAAKAPTGSLYHRFASRAELLNELWLDCLNSMTLKLYPALESGDIITSTKELGNWVGQNPDQARLLLLYEEGDVITQKPCPETYKKINKIHQKLGKCLTDFLSKKNKPPTAENLSLLNYIIFEGPISAYKPYLRGNDQLLPQCKKIALRCTHANLDLL